MCSIDSKHSPSITFDFLLLQSIPPPPILKSEYLFPHPLFPFPYAISYEVATSLKIINEKHACYHFKKSVAFDFSHLILDGKSSFFTLTPMYFLNIYPKCLPILREYSHCTPLISQNNKLAGLRVFTQKFFYATKVPKSFKIFGTKPTFLLLNGTLSINFIRFKRSSITFEFFQQLPSLSRDLFLYWVFCFFLHLFMNPVYNFQNKLPSDGIV